MESSRESLPGLSAVLRQPQTETDLGQDLLRVLDDHFGHPQTRGRWGTPRIEQARFACVTPLDENVFLVPCEAPTARDLQALPPDVRAVTERQWASIGASDRLGIFVIHRGQHGGGGLTTAAAIERGKAATWTGCSNGIAVVLVVPDGVADVTLVVRPPDVPDKAPVSVTGAANNNVVALIVPGTPDMPTENMIWYDRSGYVTRHWSRSRDLCARSH